MLGYCIFITLLAALGSAERPLRGPKVSTVAKNLQEYVVRPSSSDKSPVQPVMYQPMYQPQQVFYQPQPQGAFQPAAPVQYVQQPMGYQPVMYQPVPVKYVQQPVQYQPVQYVKPSLLTAAKTEDSEEKESADKKSETSFIQTEQESKRPQSLSEQTTEEEESEPEYYRATSQDVRLVHSVMKSAARTRATFYKAKKNDEVLALTERLPSNYTTIRVDKDIVDTFSCNGRKYGYYADVANDCQIFHICLNYEDIYAGYTTASPNEHPAPSDTYTFSFICPKYTRFAQDYLVCGWASEVPKCNLAESLYNGGMNARFFEIYKKTTTPPPRS